MTYEKDWWILRVFDKFCIDINMLAFYNGFVNIGIVYFCTWC